MSSLRELEVAEGLRRQLSHNEGEAGTG